jgi:hypothetical protein
MSNRKRKRDHGNGGGNLALSWYPWLVEDGSHRAFSRFGIASYIARPALESIGFDLYRAGFYLGWHLTTNDYQRWAADTEAMFANIHHGGRGSNVR